MEQLGGPPPVRDLEDADVAAEDCRELPRPGVGGAERPRDAEEVGPKPERVPAVDGPRRPNPAQRRDSANVHPPLELGLLTAPGRLAGAEGDGAPIGDEEGVERVG